MDFCEVIHASGDIGPTGVFTLNTVPVHIGIGNGIHFSFGSIDFFLGQRLHCNCQGFGGQLNTRTTVADGDSDVGSLAFLPYHGAIDKGSIAVNFDQVLVITGVFHLLIVTVCEDFSSFQLLWCGEAEIGFHCVFINDFIGDKIGQQPFKLFVQSSFDDLAVIYSLGSNGQVKVHRTGVPCHFFPCGAVDGFLFGPIVQLIKDDFTC